MEIKMWKKVPISFLWRCFSNSKFFLVRDMESPAKSFSCTLSWHLLSSVLCASLLKSSSECKGQSVRKTEEVFSQQFYKYWREHSSQIKILWILTKSKWWQCSILKNWKGVSDVLLYLWNLTVFFITLQIQKWRKVTKVKGTERGFKCVMVLFAVLGMEVIASCMLSKHSELSYLPSVFKDS